MTRRRRLLTIAAGVGISLAVGMTIGAQLPRAADDPAFDRRVRAYLQTHPELVAEAVDRMRIDPYRQRAEKPFDSAWAGDRDGDVTLVVFTDYSCPYCRASAPILQRALANDARLKIVWREIPVLGPDSEAAAAAALAAAHLGRYAAFHAALMDDRPNRRGIARAATVAGIDPKRLVAEAKAAAIRDEIANNLDLARQLQIGATPFFIIGNRAYEGMMRYEALVAAVAEARKAAG